MCYACNHYVNIPHNQNNLNRKVHRSVIQHTVQDIHIVHILDALVTGWRLLNEFALLVGGNIMDDTADLL